MDVLSFDDHLSSGVNFFLEEGGSGTFNDGEGLDTYSGIEGAGGTEHDDTLTGNNSDNVLFGEDGADVLRGQLGSDTLAGGAGPDNLTGGDGADVFRFEEIGSADGDWISDFDAQEGDVIELNGAVFRGLDDTGGFLSSDCFLFTSVYTPASYAGNTLIVYDTVENKLHYVTSAGSDPTIATLTTNDLVSEDDIAADDIIIY